MDEVAYAVRDYLGKLESDTGRLEDIESRLAALDRLKRKYGETIGKVLAFRDDVAKRIDEVENASENRERRWKNSATPRRSKYTSLAGELSRKRAAAAAGLSQKVEGELKSLMMDRTQFQIVVTTGQKTAMGADEIAFLVSPNRGEELKPLEKIASGRRIIPHRAGAEDGRRRVRESRAKYRPWYSMKSMPV